ncbi:PAS/PAC sensor hybrid histidine kinase [Desulfatibacillum aliphaticivorans]|uniref:histidine kinase n=1 Tax=Desulfatibacillum aliphaticivorans TaxID=218208 RepID=B8FJI2_DESAL|nr:PAS domain S-box protein [Desulfatibacillum aliphaticivorans]ACL05651.1 PAS/PAC sensor hybrid histidine kinase [Desulfatibacillum aliphaticivorans]
MSAIAGPAPNKGDLEKRIFELEAELELLRASGANGEDDLFRTMYESSNVGIARVALDFTILEANRAYCGMLGYSEEELIGKTLQEITAPESIPENIEKQKQLRDLKIDSFRMEKEFIRKDGSQAWGLLHASVIKNRQGEAQYFLGSVADITDRKKVEAELRESEFKYRTLFENMEQGVFYQKDTGEMFDANSRALELFGLTRDEFLGRTSMHPEWKVFDEEGNPLKPEDYPSRKTLSTGRAIRDQVVGVYNPRKKQMVWLSVSAIPQCGHDHELPCQVFVTLHDLTALRNMQRRLSQSHKLEAIGTLAGGIAHDFNNLLSVVLGNAELAVSDTPHDSPAAESLLEIQSAGMRARDVVRQLLEFAKPEGKRKQLVDFIGIVQESIRFLRATIPSTVDIQVKILINKAPVMADPSNLYQVMINLCTNAAHAMAGRGGVLGVNVARHESNGEDPDFFALAPGEYVRLSVSDTGIGMDAQTQNKIFDPYFTTRDVGEGAGMGLAVVHGILETHGGRIHVESEPEKGSTFTVVFPLASALPTAPALSGNGYEGGNERILLVDDEASVLRTVNMMLERLGYQVTPYNDALEALKAFKERPEDFDAIVTDMTMPGLTGVLLAEEAIAVKPGVPVVLCTGYSENIDEETAKDQGISAFIMKPVVRREMARVIRFALDGAGSSGRAVKSG